MTYFDYSLSSHAKFQVPVDGGMCMGHQFCDFSYALGAALRTALHGYLNTIMACRP